MGLFAAITAAIALVQASSPASAPPPPPPSHFIAYPVPLNQSRWIVFDDNIGIDGDVFFRLDINAKGKVTACTVTKSSGSDALDAHTCKLLKKRAKFQPAFDRQGARTASSYWNSIRWRDSGG